MRVVPNIRWFELLFQFRGSVFRYIWAKLLLTLALSVAVVLAFHRFPHLFEKSLTVLPFTLIGLTIGIVLGFRNNTSYDRFWEGRKLWGRMVNVSRSFTRQIMTLVKPTDETAPEEDLDGLRRMLVGRHIAYVHLFRLHLRDLPHGDELNEWIGEEEARALDDAPNRPNALLQRTGELIADAAKRGFIHPYHHGLLEESMVEMSTVQGACERIKSTPIPFSYNVLIHRVVAFYCLGLPFGIVTTIDYATPVVVGMVSYAFFGLDAIGEEIEEPFGLDSNDLPLDALSRMIEVNLRAALGEKNLPPMLEPVDGFLS